jgi:hypothetical protein
MINDSSFSPALRIRDVYAGSRISDPGLNIRTKRGGGKFFLSYSFFVAKALKIIVLCTQKIVTKLSKNGFGIRDPE